MTEDKRYRECMAEITHVLRKFDMAGAVTVVAKDRAMFKCTFPTWSCIRVTETEVRFKAKREDYPSKEAQQETVELSVHIIMQMRDIAARTFAFCEQIHQKLGEHFEIEHKPFHDFDPERSH
jgi:hypothetical protein